MLVSGSSSSSPHFLAAVVSATCEVKLINTISLIKATAARQVKIETSKRKNKRTLMGRKKEKVAITVNEFNAKGARQTHLSLTLPLSLCLSLASFSKHGYSLDA